MKVKLLFTAAMFLTLNAANLEDSSILNITFTKKSPELKFQTWAFIILQSQNIIKHVSKRYERPLFALKKLKLILNEFLEKTKPEKNLNISLNTSKEQSESTVTLNLNLNSSFVSQSHIEKTLAENPQNNLKEIMKIIDLITDPLIPAFWNKNETFLFSVNRSYKA